MVEAEPGNLETEVEADDTPYVEFDLSVSPADPPLEMLANQVENGDLIIPFYQRKFVWRIEQASKLIESFLMGLPVPQIFLYVNDENQLEVIDGQQRILSVKYFIEGYFGDPDKQGRRQVFRLKGLAERSEFNGKTFQELSDRDKRRFRNSTLRAIHIKQLRPKGSSDSVFYIFERLNTGGTQLKPQEIRNAVYRGPIVGRLKILNEIPSWQKILGLKTPDRNQKDVELVLRLFSLFEKWRNYEKPMLRYLNLEMKENRAFDSERAKRFEARFPEVVQNVQENIVKPFRPSGVINSSVLEAVILALLEGPNINGEKLAIRYRELLADENFKPLIRGATTDTQVLRSRIEKAHEIIVDASA